jgi:hypothetical protein
MLRGSRERRAAPVLRWLVLLLVGVLVASIAHAHRHARMEEVR